MLASAEAPIRAADGRLTEEESDLIALAEQRLHSAAYTELRRISCDLENGVLTLNGAVPRYYLKQHAYRMVADLTCGRHAINEIVVTNRAAGNPAALRTSLY